MAVELCSVVVPVYNGARYLHETIGSFLAQDYPAKELVAVDDASSDESPEILEQYQSQHPRLIRVVRHDVNGGIVRSVLDGIAASEGQYVALFGHDDVMLEGRLSTLVRAIRKHKVSMVCSNAYYLFGDTPSRRLVHPERRWRADRYVRRHEFLYVNRVVGSSVLFSRQDFERIDPAVFGFRHSLEWAQWFEYACLRGIYYLASPLLYYRRHETNISRRQFTTTEHREWKAFCRSHILARLTVWEIILASIEHFQARLASRLWGEAEHSKARDAA